MARSHRANFRGDMPQDLPQDLPQQDLPQQDLLQQHLLSKCCYGVSASVQLPMVGQSPAAAIT